MDRQLEIRPITSSQFAAYCETVSTAFGENLPAEEVEDYEALIEYDRTLAAFDGDRIVGTGGADSMEMTLPGGATIPVGGLTAIGVLPTHRRRGILRAIVERHFEDVDARGEPVSALLASESTIYGRFGYGMATVAADYEIDTRSAAFRTPPAPVGQFRLLDPDEVSKVLPEFYERYRRGHAGELSMKAAWWPWYARDPEYDRDGASRHYDVVHETTPGRIDGWASYRVKDRWDAGLANHLVRVRRLLATNREAEAALFRFCLDLDLVATVRLALRPLDEPLRFLLADPRRLRAVELGDYLWLRLLDLPGALAARCYAAAGAVVFDVSDPLRPRNQGRFRLEGGPDGAACAPAASAAPDLALGVAELGAAYLGGTSLTTLARAGLVTELRPGALSRADAMFTSHPSPWTTVDF